MLVGAEEGGDGTEDGEGGGARSHDHVGDLEGDGAVHPVKNHGVHPQPLCIGQRIHHVEMIGESELGGGDGEKIPPLGEV